jgi:hypothetical protein
MLHEKQGYLLPFMREIDVLAMIAAEPAIEWRSRDSSPAWLAINGA